MEAKTIQIKPLSVNDCWKGRRFKTKEYSAYAKKLYYMLPNIAIPLPPYRVVYEFGLSNKMADWDNPVKPFQDILQYRYGFNDRDIVEAIVKKVIVTKGEEYVSFLIEKI